MKKTRRKQNHVVTTVIAALIVSLTPGTGLIPLTAYAQVPEGKSHRAFVQKEALATDTNAEVDLDMDVIMDEDENPVLYMDAQGEIVLKHTTIEYGDTLECTLNGEALMAQYGESEGTVYVMISDTGTTKMRQIGAYAWPLKEGGKHKIKLSKEDYGDKGGKHILAYLEGEGDIEADFGSQYFEVKQGTLDTEYLGNPVQMGREGETLVEVTVTPDSFRGLKQLGLSIENIEFESYLLTTEQLNQFLILPKYENGKIIAKASAKGTLDEVTVKALITLDSENYWQPYLPITFRFAKEEVAPPITPPIQQTKTLTLPEANTREDIKRMYQEWSYSTTSPVTYERQPGNHPYMAGELSSQTKQNGLNALNFVRYLAGVGSVELDAEYENLAQKAAFANQANRTMSHYPKKPAGMPEDFYQEAALGARKSNLAYGSRNLADSLMQYWIADEDGKNKKTVGHRRWCLNPAMERTGFGFCGIYSAMYAFDKSGTTSVDAVVWPAQVMPYEMFSGPFSIQLYNRAPIPKKDEVEVTVVSQKSGKVWKFSQKQADGTFYVNSGGYGDTANIIFDPKGVAKDDVLNITVTGLYDEGKEATMEYSVEFFRMNQSSGSTGGSSSSGGSHSGGSSGGSSGGGGGSSSGKASLVGSNLTNGLPTAPILGTWNAQADGRWRFTRHDGTEPIGAWQENAGKWYHFDAKGYMQTGWYVDLDGNHYYLNPEATSAQGELCVGWKLIDGKWYYFKEISDGTKGAMLKTQRTPDGYWVGADGVWDGMPAL